MSFQWLQMRISEEKDRRHREATVRARMPRAMDELEEQIWICVESYQKAFGAEACSVVREDAVLHIVASTETKDGWEQQGRVEVSIDLELPGFRVLRGGEPLMIELGMLPGDRVSYRDRAADQYLNLEDLTKRILDRAFFPRLKD